MTFPEKDNTLFRHIALLLLLAIFWSSSFTMIKVAVETVPPVTLVAARLAIAAILLTLFLKIIGKKLPRFGRDWTALFIVAFTGNSLPFFLITWGETGIDSGMAAILMALMPLATLVLAHFFTDTDKMTSMKFVGVSIGLIGICILVGPKALMGLGGNLINEMAVAAAAVSYAVTTVIIRRMPAGGDPIERSAGVMICAAIQMVPISLALDQPWLLSPSMPSIIANVYIGIFPTAIAAIIHFYLVAQRGTTFFALINYIIPCMGVAWGAMFLGEIISWNMMFALVVILGGIGIANLRKKNRAG
jgi:drug/metabolite transporter (DMT)-like permease